MEGEIFTLEESEKRIHLFIVSVCRELNLFFHCELKSDDFLLLNTSREGKLFYHLVIQNGLYFDSMPEHEKFMLWLRHKFSNPSQDNEEEALARSMLTWHRIRNDLVYETKSIFDMAVYCDNQKFQCINQSKYGKGNILKNPNVVNMKDSLIGLYERVGDRRCLNVSALEFEIRNSGKKSSSKKNGTLSFNTVQPLNNQDFTPTGETLMIINKESYEDLKKYQDFE